MAQNDVPGHGLDLKPSAGAHRRELVRRTEFGLLVALLAQFLLGMAVNLFVKIPESHPGSNPPEYFGGVAQGVGWALTDGGLWLALHTWIGLLLVLGALTAFLQSIRCSNRAAITTSAVGLFSVLGAGFNGGSFLNYGEDFSSMIMALLFALATGSYALGVYLLDRRER